MTKDEALKLALEALDGLSEPYDVLKAQEAIREALAQPEQEPVCAHGIGKTKCSFCHQPEHEFVRGECVKCGASIERQEPVAWVSEIAEEAELMLEKPRFRAVPLYTTPPQRKPLTDEEIDKLPWEPHEGNPMTFAEGLRYFARAIEAAHGIKGDA